MSTLTDYTKEQQARLAAYCRDGNTPKLDGVTEGRLATYRRLVFNNVRDALVRSYPLTKNALREKEWTVLVSDFFEQHTCTDPQIWRMPEELIDYVYSHQPKLQENYPFLIDLLTFEWTEIELHMMPDEVQNEVANVQPKRDAWILNPEHRIMQFSYPVHQKNARYITAADAGNYFCLGHRGPDDGKVHFTNLTPLLAEILSALAQAPAPIQTIFNRIADAAGIEMSFEEVEGALLQFYSQKHQQGLFLG